MSKGRIGRPPTRRRGRPPKKKRGRPRKNKGGRPKQILKKIIVEIKIKEK